MTTFSGSGKVVDTINLDTPRIIEHDDGIGPTQALKRWLARLRDDDEDEDEDDGDVDSAVPVHVELGRIKTIGAADAGSQKYHA
eukprot:m.356788 g.356788  ORF g.356788 m.356788 type:complete len:84 (+) comp28020_c0_seq38:1875-2126(+)